MADFVLRVVEGNAAGTEVPVGDELMLGRGVEKPGNLGGDATLSRRHARIVRRDGDELLLEDLGSHNGTLVNGAAITEPVILVAGDRIELGETALELIRVEPAVPSDPGRTRVSHRIVAPGPPPAAGDAPTPTAGDQPTRLGEVPAVAPVPASQDQPTRSGEVPAVAPVPASQDQPTRLGEVPAVAPVPASQDQPTRLGEVPAVAPAPAPASQDQPTRLGEVPAVAPVPASQDQPTRLGEVPVEAAGSGDQPTRGGVSPAPAEEEAAQPEEAPRAPWWRRLLGGSR